MNHPIVTLHNGVEMPALGFGTWALARNAYEAVSVAIAAGYRHVDTAAMYGNERAVGAAVRDSGVDRSEIFVTTKIWNNDHGYQRSQKALELSRSMLDIGPIDLVLIHWPGGPDRLETWRQLEDSLADGVIRSIGVSNYGNADLDELLRVAEVVPMVNQIEFNPRVLRRQLPIVQRCRSEGIAVTGWRPLGKGRLLGHPVVEEIERRIGRTAAQILLRWSLQHGVVPLPKSERPERIRSNARIFDFELTNDDMAQLEVMGR